MILKGHPFRDDSLRVVNRGHDAPSFFLRAEPLNKNIDGGRYQKIVRLLSNQKRVRFARPLLGPDNRPTVEMTWVDEGSSVSTWLMTEERLRPKVDNPTS